VWGRNRRESLLIVNAGFPLSSRVLEDTTNNATIIACAKNADMEKVKVLKELGAQLIITRKDDKVDLPFLLQSLSKMGVQKVLLEGGSGLNWSMLEEGFVDELRITIAPILVGGSESKGPIGGSGVDQISNAFKLSLLGVSKNEQTEEVLVSYKVQRRDLAKVRSTKLLL
jgi:diaminohydroxyphosphoribosylaminopyrimidine deaminase/5-amino-6-(5-phosphoribosylamino)uracil reductase